MTLDQQKFVMDLYRNCADEAQRSLLMRFSLKTLLEDQEFLAELVVLEAEFRAKDNPAPGCKASDLIALVLHDLGLVLVEKQEKNE